MDIADIILICSLMKLFHLSVYDIKEYYSTNDLTSLLSEKSCSTTSVHNRDPQIYIRKSSHTTCVNKNLCQYIFEKGVPQLVYKIKNLPVYYLKHLENTFATTR